MGHAYYQSAKAEQRQEAIERNRMEAILFLKELETKPQPRRVLETVN